MSLDTAKHAAKSGQYFAVRKTAQKAAGESILYQDQIAEIGARVWDSIQAWFDKKRRKPHFKSRKNGVDCIKCPRPTLGAFDKETKRLYYRDKSFKVLINAKDQYVQDALKLIGTKKEGCKGVLGTAWVRRIVKGKTRIYLQVTIAGNPPTKHIYAVKGQMLAIDPSLQAVNCYSPQFVGRLAVAPNADLHLKIVRRLQRKLDRSLRATNKDSFNDDGTIKKGEELKKFSNNYKKTLSELKELKRKETVLRKCEHGQSINFLLSIAGTIRIEDNSYKAMQRGHYGKTLARSGIGTWVTRLKNKAKFFGLEVIEVSPKNLRPSQYEPTTNTFVKKALRQRWVRLDDDNLIHRDTLSALEIFYADLENEKHDQQLLLSVLQGERPRLIAAAFWKQDADKQSAKKAFSELFAPDPRVLTAEWMRQERLSGSEVIPLVTTEEKSVGTMNASSERGVSEVAGAAFFENQQMQNRDSN